jgi:tetratricopeptide (TPR) repeat protein
MYVVRYIENFPQAVEDYKSALSLLSSLPSTSPSIAEAHYKLAVVLESTENGREEAVENVKKAIQSVEGRKEKLNEVEEVDREKVRKEIEALLKDLNAKVRARGANLTAKQDDHTC